MTDAVRIKVIGSAVALYKNPVWVKSFEDTACGRGKLEVTEKVEEAKVFPHFGEAMKFWRTRSEAVPTRMDGKPNRPMTAYTIEVLRV